VRRICYVECAFDVRVSGRPSGLQLAHSYKDVGPDYQPAQNNTRHCPVDKCCTEHDGLQPFTSYPPNSSCRWLELIFHDWILSQFLARSQNCEKQQSVSDCLSVDMEHSATTFHEIWYWSILRKSVYKIQVSLKSDNNNGFSTWRPCTFTTSSRSVTLRTRNVSVKICRENKNSPFYVQ